MSATTEPRRGVRFVTTRLTAALRVSVSVAVCAALPAGCARDRLVGGQSRPPARMPVAAVPPAVGPAPRADGGTSLPDAAAAKPALTRPAGPLNVVLILIDSLRADMPWAGYPRAIAPNLTDVEQKSVSYTRAYSISSVTAKSVGGILAGKYPSSIPRNGFFDTTYSRKPVFFPEVLEQAGVHTMAAHAHTYMGGPGHKGLDQGFAVWKLVRGLTYDMAKDRDVTSQKLTPLAIRLLDAAPPDRPFFLYVHFMDPHDMYVKHREAPDWGDRARDRYDQEVFYTDLWIGKLLDYMRGKPWWKDTAIIISADHGEAFGEHGQHRHAFELWNVLTHVPLFFFNTGAEPRRIDTPRGQIDLAPTVLDLMGLPTSPDFAGKSLVPELFGASPEPRPVVLDLPKDSGNRRRRAVIRGSTKLLVFGGGWRQDLYDLDADPGELRNLAKEEPAELAEMKALFDEVWGEIPFVRAY